MDSFAYLRVVIDQVHRLTLRGELRWDCRLNRVTADATPAIRIAIQYEDVGPDSADWEYVAISNPVGEGTTSLGNWEFSETVPVAKSPGGRALEQINEIFRHVLLEPRRAEFETAMRQLAERLEESH